VYDIPTLGETSEVTTSVQRGSLKAAPIPIEALPMKAFIRTAVATGLALVAFAPVSAAEITEDRIEIRVVNGHGEDVRVYVERVDGRIIALDRIRRGETTEVEVPAELAGTEYRLKFVRVPSDIWDYASDLTAVKTATFSATDLSSVVVRLENDLSRSGIDVTRRSAER
jgi:hypothetical protein